jgi:hypothetical protein
VRVQIDEARRDQRALGIDHALCRLPREIAHCDDASVTHCNIGWRCFRPCAIDHQTTANQDIV